jgi:Ras homolog gene family, member A
VLVGNKTDLINDSNTKLMLNIANLKTVSTSQAQMVADVIKAFDYLECSAKANDGLHEVIECGVRAALQTNMIWRIVACCFKRRRYGLSDQLR